MNRHQGSQLLLHGIANQPAKELFKRHGESSSALFVAGDLLVAGVVLVIGGAFPISARQEPMFLRGVS